MEILHYQILEELGSGSLTTVYKVKREGIDDVFAAKVLRSEFANNPRTAKRYAQEGQKAAGLNDPHLVSVYEVTYTDDNRPVLICDFVEGGDLVERLAEGPLPELFAISMLRQIGQGLECAHNNGVIHRDLKPANVVFQIKQGGAIIKLADFGVAKVLPSAGRETKYFTPEGEAFGNPTYMSPEQLQGARVDARSDIYSLGCLLYECLAGRPPFKSANAIRVAFKQIQDEPPPIAEVNGDVIVSAGLQLMLGRMLEKNPLDRYQSMAQVFKDLKIVEVGGLPRIPARVKVAELPEEARSAEKATKTTDRARAVAPPAVASAPSEPSEKEHQKIKLKEVSKARPRALIFKPSMAGASVQDDPVHARGRINAGDVAHSMALGAGLPATDRKDIVNWSSGLSKGILFYFCGAVALLFFVLIVAFAQLNQVKTADSYPVKFLADDTLGGEIISLQGSNPESNSESNSESNIDYGTSRGNAGDQVFYKFHTGKRVIRAEGSLENCVIHNTKFCQAKMRGRNFRLADLRGCDFTAVDLSGADFSYANLQDVDFADANLSNTVFVGANLTNADLSRANCHHIDLRGAQLLNVRVLPDQLDSAKLRGALNEPVH